MDIEYVGKIDAPGYGYCGRIFVDGAFRGSCDLPASFCEAVEGLVETANGRTIYK